MTMEHTALRPSQKIAANDLTVRGTIVAAIVSMALVTLLDLVIDGHIGLLFSLGFVLIVVTMPLAVDVHDLFPAGVLPPVLMLGTLGLICLIRPEAISVDGMQADAGLIGRYIAAVIDQGLALVIGHGLAIAVIVWRILRDV